MNKFKTIIVIQIIIIVISIIGVIEIVSPKGVFGIIAACSVWTLLEIKRTIDADNKDKSKSKEFGRIRSVEQLENIQITAGEKGDKEKNQDNDRHTPFTDHYVW